MYYLILPVVVVLAFIIVSGYVKAPPDMAYIISGMGKNNRILMAAPVSASRSCSGWTSCI